MKSGIEYLLKLVDWQVFMTLTYRDPLPSTTKRERLAEQFLQDVAKWERTTLSSLPSCIRWETGESTGRPHCHVLLAGFPDRSRLTPRWCIVRAKQWYRRGGLAKVKLWVPGATKGGSDVAYVTKNSPVWGIGASFCNGADYELAKTARADRIILSDSLWQVVQRKTRSQFAVAAHS
jgi:hypothetical protein